MIEVLQVLARIEGKVDDLATQSATLTERVGNLKDTVATNRKDIDALDARTNSLEHFRTGWIARTTSWAAGIAVAVSVLAGVAGDFIKNLFTGPTAPH